MLPLLWSHLRLGGVLFIDQTPYRYFPLENHTTGLPLLNYLPAPVVLRTARFASRRLDRNEGWESLLRKGIRGGSPGEILGILDNRAKLLEPSRLGADSRIDMWFRMSIQGRFPGLKKVVAGGLGVLHKVSGAVVTPMLSLAIEKS